MLLRTLLIMVNMATIVAVIFVLHDFPQYAGSAFYILLGWMIGSLVLLYGPWANRPVGALRTAPGTPAPTLPSATTTPGSSVPLPSVAPPAEIPFCIYCAAPLTANAPVCPACGHRAPYL
ncbi:MAG: hypothetical protein ACLPZM_02070 [Thermoplasmata archaeon]